MEYKSEITAGIVSYLRRNTGDSGKLTVRADEEHFEFIDSAIKTIAQETKCLSLPLFIDLKPGQKEYNSNQVLSELSCLIQIDTVVIVKGSDVETVIYELTPVTTNEYNDSVSNECESEPAIYVKTEKGIKIYQPIDAEGYKLKIEGDRLPLPSEGVSYDQDPVIPLKYHPYIKYGAMVELALAYPVLDINIESFQNKFEEYSDLAVIPKNKKTEFYPQREF